MLGSTVLTTLENLSGSTAFRYLPFGEQVKGDQKTPFTFTGLRKEHIGGGNRSELYSAQYRHLRPRLGRWTARDPAGQVDGPNLYRYVRNSPTQFIDPTGMLSTLGKLTRGQLALISLAISTFVGAVAAEANSILPTLLDEPHDVTAARSEIEVMLTQVPALGATGSQWRRRLNTFADPSQVTVVRTSLPLLKEGTRAITNPRLFGTPSILGFSTPSNSYTLCTGKQLSLILPHFFQAGEGQPEEIVTSPFYQGLTLVHEGLHLDQFGGGLDPAVSRTVEQEYRSALSVLSKISGGSGVPEGDLDLWRSALREAIGEELQHSTRR